MSTTATILGATGMIGGEVLALLLEDPAYSNLRVVGRSSCGIKHPKLEEFLIDLHDQNALEQAIAGSETVFVAVGTTNRQVKGDKEAYRKVDFDIPVNAAKAAAKFGVYGFALVSAVGADPNNEYNFYIKLKGVTEETVAEQMIPQTMIFRPSLLMGERKEKRPMEKVAQFVMPVVNLCLRGSWRRYKGIAAVDVAKAMVNAAKTKPKGIHFFEYEEMMALAGK